MGRRSAATTACLFAALLAGCTAAEERGGRIVPPVRLHVAPLEAAEGDGGPTDADCAYLRARLLRRLLRVEGIAVEDASAAATHTLELRVRRLEPGEGVLRFVVGLGAGPADVAAAAAIRDASGVEVAGLDFERTYPAVIWREPALRRRLADDCAAAVARFVRARTAPPPKGP